jgi:hypothetical protein
MTRFNAPPEIVVAMVIVLGRRAVAMALVIAMVAPAGMVTFMPMLVVPGVVLVVMHIYFPDPLIRYIALYRIIHTVGFWRPVCSQYASPTI